MGTLTKQNGFLFHRTGYARRRHDLLPDRREGRADPHCHAERGREHLVTKHRQAYGCWLPRARCRVQELFPSQGRAPRGGPSLAGDSRQPHLEHLPVVQEGRQLSSCIASLCRFWGGLFPPGVFSLCFELSFWLRAQLLASDVCPRCMTWLPRHGPVVFYIPDMMNACAG